MPLSTLCRHENVPANAWKWCSLPPRQPLHPSPRTCAASSQRASSARPSSGTTTHPIEATTCCFPAVDPPKPAPNQHRKCRAGWGTRACRSGWQRTCRQAPRVVTHRSSLALRLIGRRSRSNSWPKRPGPQRGERLFPCSVGRPLPLGCGWCRKGMGVGRGWPGWGLFRRLVPPLSRHRTPRPWLPGRREAAGSSCDPRTAVVGRDAREVAGEARTTSPTCPPRSTGSLAAVVSSEPRLPVVWRPLAQGRAEPDQSRALLCCRRCFRWDPGGRPGRARQQIVVMGPRCRRTAAPTYRTCIRPPGIAQRLSRTAPRS